MELVIAAAIGIVLLAMLGRIVSLPMHILWKLVTNSIVGAVVLWAINLFGAGVQITFLNALITGFLGIPGVILVLLLNYL